MQKKREEPIAHRRHRASHRVDATLLIATSLFASVTLTGCIGIGYSSGGGWFFWPGGLGLLFVVLLFVFLMRRR